LLTVPRATTDADLPGTPIHRTDSDRHSSVLLRISPALWAQPHPNWQATSVSFEQLVMAYLQRPFRVSDSGNPAQPTGPTTKVMSR
jgi:hypothetical protein